MSPTSKARKRKRRSQLVAVRAVPVRYQLGRVGFSERNSADAFDDWLLAYCSKGVMAVLFVLACAAVAILATFTVHASDDQHAYQNAPTCDPSTATSIVCREQVPVIVTGVRTAGTSKSHRDYVDVTGLLLPQSPLHIELRDGSAVWPILQSGDDATVELWHGQPVAITDNYVTSETMRAPGESLVEAGSFTLFAAVCVPMFGLYWLRLRHARRTGAFWPEWLTQLEPMAITAAFGFFAGALGGFFTGSFVVTLAVGGAITLFGAVSSYLVNWRARARRT